MSGLSKEMAANDALRLDVGRAVDRVRLAALQTLALISLAKQRAHGEQIATAMGPATAPALSD